MNRLQTTLATTGATPPTVAKPTHEDRLKAIAADGELDIRVQFQRIYTETGNYLERLRGAVDDGRAVEEANNFARWLTFSGVVRLLERHASIDPRYADLRKQADNLSDACKPHFDNRIAKPAPSQGKMDDLNDKVDALLAMISRRTDTPVNFQAVELHG